MGEVCSAERAGTRFKRWERAENGKRGLGSVRMEEAGSEGENKDRAAVPREKTQGRTA